MAHSAAFFRELSGASMVTAVDGIAVKLSEALTPPHKVQLPMNYQQGNPSEVLFMDYDFTLEESVIEWSEKQRETRAELERMKAEKLAEIEAAAKEAQRKAEERQKEEDEEAAVAAASGPAVQQPEVNDNDVPSSTEPNNETTVVSGPYGGVNQGILQPTVMTPSALHKRQKSEGKANSFNLADFENEQDPFDTLELKTLDDKAELNKVLQCVQNPAAAAAGSIGTDTVGNSQTSDAASGTQTACVNIKDVQYPDFDSISAPDISLQGQHLAMNGSQAEPNQEKVFILSQSFGSVSFSNLKNQKNTGLYPYESTRPGASASYVTTTQSTASGTAHAGHVAGPFYNVSGGHSSSDQAQHVATSSATTKCEAYPTYMPYRYSIGNISHALVNQNKQGDNDSTNPWLQNSTPAASTNPWGTYMNSKDHPVSVASTKATAAGANGLWPLAKDKGGITTWALSGGNNPWEVPPKSTVMSQSTHNKNPWSAQVAGGLRSARSHPDLSNLDDAPVHVMHKSHTPPPSSMMAARGASPRHYDYKSTGQASSRGASPVPVGPFYSSSSAKSTQNEVQLPDPYNGFDHVQKRFVNTIADMGFPRARVARITKQLGQDDKKVVDHLCQINQLIEEGIPPKQAEYASSLFPQNTQKAKEYVQLQKRFMQAGFVEDKVQDALLQSDLDENKTLDMLTTG